VLITEVGPSDVAQAVHVTSPSPCSDECGVRSHIHGWYSKKKVTSKHNVLQVTSTWYIKDIRFMISEKIKPCYWWPILNVLNVMF
jgi:hypothetical protein